MSENQEKRFPVGAAVNRRTGEVELQYQTGDDQAFAAVLLPLLRIGRSVLQYEEELREADKEHQEGD